MEIIKLETEIKGLKFSYEFEYHPTLIEFAKKLWAENNGNMNEPDSVDSALEYIRKNTSYKIVFMEREMELYNIMSRHINRDLDIDAYLKYHLTDHRTLQQKFTGLCLSWVAMVGDENYRFDGRNQHSHEQCAKILEFIKQNNIYTRMPLI